MNSHRLLTLAPDGNSFVIARKDNSPNQLFRYDVKNKSIVPFSD
jgi:hypothetical protein